MKDVVSNRSIWAVTSVASISFVWMILIAPPAAVLAHAGLLGLLVVSAALWVGLRSRRSMWQVIRDVDAEPQIAAAPVARAHPPRGGDTY